MSGRAAAIAIAVTGLGLGAAGGGGPAPLHGLLEGALQAMEAGEYAEALRLYEDARTVQPQSPEIPFNMGVAAYRAGDFDRAEDLFDEARLLADDPALRARSAYNLGTTAYRKSLQGPRHQGDQQETGARLDEAASELAGALERFREAIDADPADNDARANGELTHRWLKELQKMKEQHQQQQRQQQQHEQQEGQEQQGKENRQQEEQQAADQGEQQQQQQEQPGQEEQAGEGQEDQAGEAGEKPDDERAGADTRKPMSRQEAERLLQRVRDKERKRREDLARAAAAGKPPVDKDW